VVAVGPAALPLFEGKEAGAEVKVYVCEKLRVPGPAAMGVAAVERRWRG